MAPPFESDGPRISRLTLALRGLAFLVLIAIAVTLMILKSQGSFEDKVPVTALLGDVGDGLPAKSDVKYRGVLVGTVDSVSRDGDLNAIHINLTPSYASQIPRTVTARVVPSNVFAVPSIQLVDNGASSALGSGAQIPEDRSLETVRLQTTLTQARAIIAAAGRSRNDDTVGVLQLLADATDRRGDMLSRTGSQLDRIVTELIGVTTARGGTSTLESLSSSLTALQKSAPDLLDTLHHSVLPLKAVAEQKEQITSFLSGGIGTAGTIATAMENNTSKLITITTKFSPVVGVVADGSSRLTPITTRLKEVTTNFDDTFWDVKTQSATARVLVSLTPHLQYTRADCPRYGDLVAPSCSTAPIGQPGLPTMPSGMDLKNFEVPDSLRAPALIGGNVGPVGSAAEQKQIAALLGGAPDAASDLLFGMLARGSTVAVAPQNGPATAPTGGNR